jgi:hypothetical protein
MIMRSVAVALGLGLVLFSGCDLLRPNTRTDPRPVGAPPPPPQVGQLVSYMNNNADRVQAIQATQVSIDCRQGNQAVGMEAKLVCQKPRYFRLKGSVMGKPAADIGSNENEFWYWISQERPPYVFHCSYQDLNTGQVRLPFPFQPDMVISAMGIGAYDKSLAYEIKTTDKTVELIEPLTTSAGKRVRKVTVFNRYQTQPPNPQVMAHILKDENGNAICTATIMEVKFDQASQAILPVKVHLSWPEQKMEMTMKMGDVHASRLETAQAARLFNRTDLNAYPGFDLARWKPDRMEGVSQGNGVSLQRVSGRSSGWGQ